MNEADFVSRYAAIYESSRWVAEEAAPVAAASDDVEQVAVVMADCVDNASHERKLALIRAHPDLAGRAAMAGELGADSTAEQASAGLDRCTPDEYTRFQSLNERYRKKFGFPFVMAVRDRSRAQILAAFEARLQNDYETEFAAALGEIHKIARLRFAALESQ